MTVTSMRQQGRSIRAVADTLQRSPSAISRACATGAARACRGADRRGQIPEMMSIHVRLPEVDDRVMPGRWEGDFLKSAGNKSSVGGLVERTSRLVLLAKMDDATAASAPAGFSHKLNSICAPLRRSLRYDQGKELTGHRELTAWTCPAETGQVQLQ